MKEIDIDYDKYVENLNKHWKILYSNNICYKILWIHFISCGVSDRSNNAMAPLLDTSDSNTIPFKV